MTDEMILMEFEHMAQDAIEKSGGKQLHIDHEYEQYDDETEEHDNKLSDIPSFGSHIDPNYINTVKVQQKEDDWEDVETDGL